MGQMLVLILLGIVVVGLLYSAAGLVVRSWMEHRVRLRLLEKLDKHPDLLRSPENLQSALFSPRTRTNPPPHSNYVLTGAFLAIIGIACIAYGLIVRVGQLAVGVYIGGQICLLLGLVLVATWLVGRALARPRTSSKAK